ncbi:MAG: hypothetical protein M1826_003668 [Phylliscum demangeonii]|nr:MAG: hypothetical protein M1826_003668 [Phylliscum demangeonii]
MSLCWLVHAIVVSLVATASCAIVPVTLPEPGPHLLPRDDVSRSTKRLQPSRQVELLYADDAVETSPMLVRVTATHHSRPYVLVESIEDMLSDISCASGPSGASGGNSSTTLSLKFVDSQLFELASKLWSAPDALTFVTHHHSCNPKLDERAAYRTSSIRFDRNSTTAVIVAHNKDFGYASEANTSLRIQSDEAPKHLARRLRRRSLRKRDESSQTAHSWRFSMNEKWAEHEPLLGFPGMVENWCDHCSSSGELLFGMDFDFPVTDIGEWPAIAKKLARGESVAPLLFRKAEIFLKVLEPAKMHMNIRTIFHGAVTVRWPGLTFSGTNKPTFGDKIQPVKEFPLFTLGGLQFINWNGFGLLFIATVSAAYEGMIRTSNSLEAGQYIRVNLLDRQKSGSTLGYKPKFHHKVEHVEGALALVIAFGVASDLTILFKLPGGMEFKVYFGFFLDSPSFNVIINSPSGLDEDCQPSSTLKAVQVTSKWGLGLAGYANYAVYVPGWVIPRVDAFPVPARPPLYHYIGEQDHCIVIPALSKQVPWVPTPAPGPLPQPISHNSGSSSPPHPARVRPAPSPPAHHPGAGAGGGPGSGGGFKWGFDSTYQMHSLTPDNGGAGWPVPISSSRGGSRRVAAGGSKTRGPGARRQGNQMTRKGGGAAPPGLGRHAGLFPAGRHPGFPDDGHFSSA